MDSDGTNARHIALRILKEVNQDGKYANISLKENLRGIDLPDRDQAFVTQLVYGTLEKQLTIDYFLSKFAKFKRVNQWIMNILRLGAYQILYLDRVPDSAACNEAVNLCKKYGLFALQGFVNGILRNLSRNKDNLRLPDPALSDVKNLSLVYSYPEWLVEKWIKDYGISTAEDIMRPSTSDDMISIRCNIMKAAPSELKKLLTSPGYSDSSSERHDAADRPSGISVTDGYHLPEALRVSGFGDIEENRLFSQGYFTVQGEASMLDSHIVDPQPGEAILDACSSPGGKAIHMAELTGYKSDILAWDIHPHRVELIKRNAARMGAYNVRPEVHDASKTLPGLTGKLDKVLIDAPCSGLGIIHKKPDIKLRIKPDDLKEIIRLQYAILKSCSEYLKPGGVLVYSTCTINPDENERIVGKFLSERPEFHPDDIGPYLPDTLKRKAAGYYIQLLPSRDNTDGFFIARLRREG